MITPTQPDGKWTERTKADSCCEDDSLPMFQNLFARNADALSLMRILLENAPEAIVVFDGESGRFGMVNENAVRLFGRSREELLQLTPRDISPAFQPNGRPSGEMAREKIDEALNGGMPVFDWLHKHPSGRLFTTEVRLVKLPCDDRNLVRASIIDNTDRRRREQTQRAVYDISEAAHTEADLPRLYARIHNIVRGLMPADNFFIALYDQGTETITFPYFVDEKDSEPPGPRKISKGLTGLVLQTGKPILADKAFTERSRKEGDRVVVEALGASYIESGKPAAVWLGAPLLIHGQPIGVMALQDYHDESAYSEEEKQILNFVATQTAVAIERKRAEESLLEMVAKHRALFEASSQGVMLHDEEKFLEANPAAVRILGLKDVRDVVGRHPAEFAPPFQPTGESSAAVAKRFIEECMEKGSAHFEWEGLRVDGSRFPLDVLLTRIHWSGRWLIQAMVEDITDRKRAESELLKALAREKELSQMKSNFVSVVSHEFRTPLGIIMSSAQILADYFERLTAEERAEHLRSITGNTRHMSSLMEEALVLSRVDSGKMLCEPTPIDLGGLCRKITDEAYSASNRRCEIRLIFDPDATQAKADERLLRHIFTNLLSNAVKYSPPGGVVEFEVTREDRDAICQIRDQGIGIPEADREWLFEPFHRGQNVFDRPGTGLGLTIVKRCVDLHGGTIAIRSAVGAGTEMTVKLPVFDA